MVCPPKTVYQTRERFSTGKVEEWLTISTGFHIVEIASGRCWCYPNRTLAGNTPVAQLKEG